METTGNDLHDHLLRKIRAHGDKYRAEARTLVDSILEANELGIDREQIAEDIAAGMRAAKTK